jgi:pimeloyl-ACP methyl ester carboxylesterase
MKTLLRDGISFCYRDEGHGLPFVFQHGLGGDLNQPIGLYSPEAGVRLIAFDMRGHGETRPLGAVDKLRSKTLQTT